MLLFAVRLKCKTAFIEIFCKMVNKLRVLKNSHDSSLSVFGKTSSPLAVPRVVSGRPTPNVFAVIINTRVVQLSFVLERKMTTRPFGVSTISVPSTVTIFYGKRKNGNKMSDLKWNIALFLVFVYLLVVKCI